MTLLLFLGYFSHMLLPHLYLFYCICFMFINRNLSGTSYFLAKLWNINFSLRFCLTFEPSPATFNYLIVNLAVANTDPKDVQRYVVTFIVIYALPWIYCYSQWLWDWEGQGVFKYFVIMIVNSALIMQIHWSEPASVPDSQTRGPRPSQGVGPEAREVPHTRSWWFRVCSSRVGQVSYLHYSFFVARFTFVWS